jgi:hypothetical protein
MGNLDSRTLVFAGGASTPQNLVEITGGTYNAAVNDFVQVNYSFPPEGEIIINLPASANDGDVITVFNNDVASEDNTIRVRRLPSTSNWDTLTHYVTISNYVWLGGEWKRQSNWSRDLRLQFSSGPITTAQIDHNFEFRPRVTITDFTTGEEIGAQKITHTSANQTIIDFKPAVRPIIYLSI